MKKLIPIVMVAALLAAGCKSIVTGRQEPLTESEEKALLKNAVAPDAAGIQLTVVKDRRTARWKEMVMPETPVTMPLLPSGSAHSVQPIITARLNTGRPVRLVVDTGSPVNLIDVRTASDNRVQMVNPDRMRNFFQGLSGLEETYFGMTRQMTLGPKLAFRNVMVAVRSVRYQRKLAGILPLTSWDGNVLGMTTIGNFAFLTLDYPARQATFSYREYFEGPTLPVATCLSFTYESAQIRVPITLQGKEYSALVDTGNDAGLMISTNLIHELGWQQLADEGKSELYVGLGGDMALRSFQIPEMKLGSNVYANVTATTGPKEFGLVLGSGFLQNYRTTIDFRRKQLWLEQK